MKSIITELEAGEDIKKNQILFSKEGKVYMMKNIEDFPIVGSSENEHKKGEMVQCEILKDDEGNQFVGIEATEGNLKCQEDFNKFSEKLLSKNTKDLTPLFAQRKSKNSFTIPPEIIKKMKSAEERRMRKFDKKCWQMYANAFNNPL